MRLQPQAASRGGWINTRLVPPRRFIATVMDLAMVSATEWYRELVAYLAAERRCLGKAQMMRIGRTPAANQAWLLRDGFHMLPVPNSTGHRQHQDRLVDTRRTN